MDSDTPGRETAHRRNYDRDSQIKATTLVSEGLNGPMRVFEALFSCCPSLGAHDCGHVALIGQAGLKQLRLAHPHVWHLMSLSIGVRRMHHSARRMHIPVRG